MQRSASNNKCNQFHQQAVSQKDKKLTILFLSLPRPSASQLIFTFISVWRWAMRNIFSVFIFTFVSHLASFLLLCRRCRHYCCSCRPCHAVNFVVFLSFNFATIFYANDITTTKSHEFVFVCVFSVVFSSYSLCCRFNSHSTSFSPRSFAQSSDACYTCAYFAHTEFVSFFFCLTVQSSLLYILCCDESLCHSFGHLDFGFLFYARLLFYAVFVLFSVIVCIPHDKQTNTHTHTRGERES